MKRFASFLIVCALLSAYVPAQETNMAKAGGQPSGIAAVSSGAWHTIGMRADGTFATAGDNSYGQAGVEGWTGIISVSSGKWHTAGLRADGTVVAVGDNSYGQLDTGAWSDIIMVSVGELHTVGLKRDGTVVATGDNSSGQCDVGWWKGIIAVSAGAYHTVGLTRDGRAVAAGYNGQGQCDVRTWKGLVSVASGGYHTVGLKQDGTVLAAGYNEYGQCEVSGWRDIAAISAGGYHTVGLTGNGRVIATGYNEDGRCDTGLWEGIASISAGENHTAALKDDGTVIAIGYNEYGQCDVEGWAAGTAAGGGQHETPRPGVSGEEPAQAKEIRMVVTPDNPRAGSDGITVDFGQYNITRDSTLEISMLQPMTDEALGLEEQIYDFSLADGKGPRSSFNTLVTVTLPCDAEADRNVFIQRYDGERGEWELLPCSRDTQAGTVTFLTDHFSRFGQFRATGDDIPDSIFSYVGGYRGPLTPVMVTSGDISRYLAGTDLEELRRSLRIAKIPPDDALSSGLWWMDNIMGGAGYAADNELNLTRFAGLFTDAQWAKWNPVLTGIGAFFTMARISYQMYRGVDLAAAVYDNAMDITEAMLSIAAVYTGALPLAFAALGVFAAGQLYEACQWAASESMGWEELTYQYFNQHDAQFSLDGFDVVWEYEDRDGYVRLDLGGKGSAAAIDAIYRKYRAQPREMLAALNKFIDDYCDLFWLFAEENIQAYYRRKIIVQSVYATLMAPMTISKPSDAAISKYKLNFRKKLLGALKPLMQETVERIHNDIMTELLNELRRELLPRVNQEMRFEAIDPGLNGGPFSKSRYSGKDSSITFGDPATSPLPVWNKRYSWLAQYPIKAEPGSNTIYRCTYFHWLSLGCPDSMVFISNMPGDKVQSVKFKLDVPVTIVRLEAPEAMPPPEPYEDQFPGSWKGREVLSDYRWDPAKGDAWVNIEGSISVDISILNSEFYKVDIASELGAVKNGTYYGKSPHNIMELWPTLNLYSLMDDAWGVGDLIIESGRLKVLMNSNPILGYKDSYENALDRAR